MDSSGRPPRDGGLLGATFTRIRSIDSMASGSRIVSWNVNGLYNTLKDAAHRHSSAQSYLSQVLAGDIICFQEAKIQESKLEKWMACVAGYESFWAFSKEKKGYSGVVTYVREGLSPLDAKADWLGDDDDALPDDMCSEGRLMYTDHGGFVLLNVYVPNGGDRSEGRPRLGFKLRFLEALSKLCREIVSSGKHLLLVGDLNIAHKDIDVHKKFNVEAMYSQEERAWLDRFLSTYTDLYRHFHPDDRDVYTVWNQKTEARIHNEGLRIDYAICDKPFVSEVLDVQIKKMFPKSWSDHAAVVVTLKQAPTVPDHPIPAISSRDMKRFQEDQTQTTITSLFSRSNSKAAIEICELPPATTVQTVARTQELTARKAPKSPQTLGKRKKTDKLDVKQKSLKHFLIQPAKD